MNMNERYKEREDETMLHVNVHSVTLYPTSVKQIRVVQRLIRTS